MNKLTDEEKQRIMASAAGKSEIIVGSVGDLQVFSYPVNATVYLDDMQEIPTPCNIQNLTTGWHELILVPPEGYKPWYGKIQVYDHKTTFVHATLEEEENA